MAFCGKKSTKMLDLDSQADFDILTSYFKKMPLGQTAWVTKMF